MASSPTRITKHLQVQAPGVAAAAWKRYSLSDYNELQNFIRRKCKEGTSVQTLTEELEAMRCKPGEDIGAWFDAALRQRHKIGTNNLTQRDFRLAQAQAK